MEADRRNAESVMQDGAEQMLPGVLLHMIEAARPIDDSDNGSRIDRRPEQVGDALVLINDIDYGNPVQDAGIEGLPTGAGIESSAVEVDAPSLVRGVDYLGLELAQVRVVVVEAHRYSIAMVTMLLLTPSSLLMSSGIAGPFGASSGTMTLIW